MTRTRTTLAATAVLGLLLALLALPTPSTAQQVEQVADVADPVVAAAQLSQARAERAGPASHAVVGRADVFADNLAATALAGTDGVLLLTDGGPDAALRPEVAVEVEERMAPGGCTDPAVGPTVHLAGGPDAVSPQVEAALDDMDVCVERLSGPTRVETAVAVADAVREPSDTVLLARSDEWADAGAVGAYAAATHSRVLVTPPDGLHPATEAALRRYDPAQIVLLGGEVALSAAVEEAARAITDVRRVAGPTRDATAVAIATELWGDARSGDVALADGYGDGAWTYLFAGAPLAGLRDMPFLYTAEGTPAPATQAYLDANPPGTILRVGPTGPAAPEGAIADADVALQQVAALDAPTMLKARPGSGELWVTERGGRVVVVTPDATRTVLDLSSEVSTSGEGGLLGLAFSPDGADLYVSYTSPGSGGAALTSIVARFAVVDGGVDRASRAEVISVAQPASNHNGGDLAWGPDGHLWWSLGDGGGGGDTYGNGQRPDTLLGALVRIDPRPGGGYTVPDDNPFVDGGGAPEVWAYGLRNPFRFAFDPATDDLYVADVGQDAVEEVDWLPAGSGAGANFGWPVFEGTQPHDGGSLPGHVPPVWEQLHRDGNCSITGGVVYRGDAIPELRGAYLYSDLCNDSVRAIRVVDGQVVDSGDLGVSVAQPVGFGVDADGEAYVIGLGGAVAKLVPS